ncbi:MAG TPA: hypothetical protein VF666_20070 [Pyrinomonadaceae bacterium]|jgi:hypothetical protein
MPATKRTSKKGGGGGSKKGGTRGGADKRGGSKKGGSKKGGTRSLESVISTVGTIAGTVGTIAGGLAGVSTGRVKDLTVEVGRTSNFDAIVRDLKKKFTLAGCPTCRSGFDRITFKDRVLPG